jgi:hypothetical protein
MYVYASYNEPPRHDLTNLLKDEYYVVTEIIDPSVKTPAQVNIANYNFGDILFFHAEPPVAPVKPIKPKFHSGTFNYELTEAEKKLLIEKYEEELAQYEEDLETFKKAFKTFMETKGSLPSYNAIAIIVDPSVKVVADADTEAEFRMYTGKKLWVAMSAKFETTRDEGQFKLFGKLPKEMGTLVTVDAGGIKSGESLKGNTFEQILVKAFGLEFEPEVVGTIQPTCEGMSFPTIAYNDGKTEISSLTDTITISTTVDKNSKATKIKVIDEEGNTIEGTDTTLEKDAETGEFTPSTFSLEPAEDIFPDVTYKYVTYYTDEESHEEVVVNESPAMKFKFADFNVTATAEPTIIESTSDTVTLTVEKVSETNADIKSVACPDTSWTSSEGVFTSTVTPGGAKTYTLVITDIFERTVTKTVNITVDDAKPFPSIEVDPANVKAGNTASFIVTWNNSSKFTVTKVALFKGTSINSETTTISGNKTTFELTSEQLEAASYKARVHYTSGGQTAYADSGTIKILTNN